MRKLLVLLVVFLENPALERITGLFLGVGALGTFDDITAKEVVHFEVCIHAFGRLALRGLGADKDVVGHGVQEVGELPLRLLHLLDLNE